jgi:hypothetical protein
VIFAVNEQNERFSMIGDSSYLNMLLETSEQADLNRVELALDKIAVFRDGWPSQLGGDGPDPDAVPVAARRWLDDDYRPEFVRVWLSARTPAERAENELDWIDVGREDL